LKKFGNDVFIALLFALAGAALACLTLYTAINLTHLRGLDPQLGRVVFAASLGACLSAISIIIGLIFFLRKLSGNISSQRQINQQTLMARLSRDFISVSDTSALINDALQITGEFLDTGRVLVGLADEISSDTGRAVFLWSKAGADLPFPNSKGLAELKRNAFTAEQPEEIPVYCCDNTDNNPAHEMMKQVGIKAFIAAPLYLEKKFWAVLSIENFKYRKWTESERQLAGMVSSIISAAVERDMREKDRDAARQQAETASRVKGDFLANMSHEMRTPMNAIIGMTAIARRSTDLVKKEYCLNKIENASMYLLGIINDVLDMSKIEANKFSLSNDEFNFERMLQKIINVLNFRIAEKKQTLDIHVDQRIPDYLYGDELRFSQVIENMLFNAVKFTPEGGSVRLDVSVEEQQEAADPGGLEPLSDWCALRIQVSDTGIGISDEQKTRLFSAFEQVDSGISRKFGGIGLGLAISKSIIEKMDGEISVVSTPGSGTTFIFTVHLKRSFRQKANSGEAMNWKNIRVLAVDEDQNIRNYFTDIAEKLGFICDTASTGEEALYKMRDAGPYNFFFINRVLSDMEGVELSRQIKNTASRSSVALMISPTDKNAAGEDARKTGPDAFLSKPFFISGIVDTISRCMGSEDQIAALNASGIAGKNYEGRTIMLVEDVDINREIVLALLEPLGLTVICAENGLQALKLFKHSPENFDLILMDIQMPEMDGLEATRQIRDFESEAAGLAKRVPIVALTANVFREDIERCLSVGMDDHVGKPLDANIIMDKLAQYL